MTKKGGPREGSVGGRLSSKTARYPNEGRIVARCASASTFVTLDGVMQAPGGPEEDPTGRFAFGGWSVNYWDEMMDQAMGEFMAKPFDLLLGRRTYKIFAAHWPYVSNDPVADQLNGAKKYVASRSLQDVRPSRS